MKTIEPPPSDGSRLSGRDLGRVRPHLHPRLSSYSPRRAAEILHFATHSVATRRSVLVLLPALGIGLISIGVLLPGVHSFWIAGLAVLVCVYSVFQSDKAAYNHAINNMASTTICTKCGYDLRGMEIPESNDVRCPECGMMHFIKSWYQVW